LPSNFGDKNSEFIDELKGMGALNFYWVQTSNSSGRSITIWPDQATAQAAIYRIREGASADTGIQIACVCEGNVIGSMRRLLGAAYTAPTKFGFTGAA
jgi:hypothetical protein